MDVKLSIWLLKVHSARSISHESQTPKSSHSVCARKREIINIRKERLEGLTSYAGSRKKILGAQAGYSA